MSLSIGVPKHARALFRYEYASADSFSKARSSALETGVDGVGPKYNIYINNTTVNGFAENDKCVGYENIVGNKNYLTFEYLNIVIDGVDVY